jgi:hypothetical protein
MNKPSYIRAVGDLDYNFAYNDFTVEFFVSTNTSNGCQTLFEITNNESAAANLYTKTRFLTLIENGNLNAYAIGVVAPFYIGANISSFTSPIPIASDIKIFYDGSFLESNQYSVSGSSVTLSNISLSTSNALVEIGQILFNINGNEISENDLHFISAERFQNQFYLFLDGQSQSAPVSAFNAIPSQVLTNTISYGNIQRYDSPALLTIGANRDGIDPLFGQFGDFKITNGTSRHVQATEIQNTISSQFTDANLGSQISSIEIEGDSFINNITNYSPEELVPSQIFDTLYLQVYQSDTSNANANILSFAMFKPTIMAGPIGSYSFIIPSNNSKIAVPWTYLDAASASILVNGIAIPSTSWAIYNGLLSIIASPGDIIKIITTGPTNYYDVCSNSVSIITSNVYANSTTINVSSTAPFITPAQTTRGQIFINQECITYLYIDRLANTLSGLTRGTSGTGVPNVHLIDSRVVSASNTQDIQFLANVDPRTAIWYTIPLANTSLQNTNTIISSVLVNSGGLSPVTPF